MWYTKVHILFSIIPLWKDFLSFFILELFKNSLVVLIFKEKTGVVARLFFYVLKSIAVPRQARKKHTTNKYKKEHPSRYDAVIRPVTGVFFFCIYKGKILLEFIHKIILMCYTFFVM